MTASDSMPTVETSARPAETGMPASPLQLQSTLTCPHCGHQALETMPTDACLYFYDCQGCGEVLRPKPGDCCVFCSYGSAPCPPKQGEHSGGATCCTSENTISASAEGSGDWAGGLRSYAVAWGIPTAIILAGLIAPLPIRTALWSMALAWMGGACIVNARRCGRTHCRFTGPYYLAMILPVLLLGSGIMPAGLIAWLALGITIILGAKVIWWVTERKLGRYS